MDDNTRLRHILDAATEAIDLTRNRSRQDLDTDRLLNLSLVRLLEIIGEAANAVSCEFRQAHPDLPWHYMIGIRNRLIHGYYDVNLDVVWQTIQNDLPSLVAQLRVIFHK